MLSIHGNHHHNFKTNSNDNNHDHNDDADKFWSLSHPLGGNFAVCCHHVSQSGDVAVEGDAKHNNQQRAGSIGQHSIVFCFVFAFSF